MKGHHHIRTEELLLNESFIHFVVAPTQELTTHWTHQFRLHPELIASANEAAAIISDQPAESALSKQEIMEMFHRILEQCGVPVA
ncbi:MAG: hypothetical protein PHU68_06950 [Paludibacter sp.]|jgi:hypothetical protein|nr:hypothetical protein [Paludibacter sp.]